MLPTFFVIGAMKAGTTSLTMYLASHPEVFLALAPVEPNFFGSDEKWNRGLRWYESLFDKTGPARALGDSSTGYTRAPHVPRVPERIASVVPGARLVYIIRNPVERIRSMYIHYLHRGQELRSLGEAVEQNPAYLDLSRYAYQLDLYLEHFSLEQILVIGSEELQRRPAETLARVFRFIGVEVDSPVPEVRRELNRSTDKSIPTKSYRALRDLASRMRLRSVLPASARRRVRRLMSRPPSPELLVVPPPLEREIWDELADDLVRLRALVGPDMDLWGHA